MGSIERNGDNIRAEGGEEWHLYLLGFSYNFWFVQSEVNSVGVGDKCVSRSCQSYVGGENSNDPVRKPSPYPRDAEMP